MPRERKYKTVEEFEKKIDEFIELVKAGEIPRPSDYYLIEFLGISASTLDRYYKGYNNTSNNNDDEKDIYKGFEVPLKKLVLFRADRLTALAEADSKQTASAIFQLKQAHNGGYTDKQQTETSGNIAINVTLKGADGQDLKR